MRFDGLKFYSVEYAGFVESCLLGVIVIRVTSTSSTPKSVSFHLLLLYSLVLNRVELGYLVMLLNQMKCSGYKIYWNVFVNIEPLKCNEHQFKHRCMCMDIFVSQGKSEWPMFFQSVDSFPFWQISGTRYVLF